MSSMEDGKIPDDIHDALAFLEDQLSAAIALTEMSTPPRNAPPGEQIAHAQRVYRIMADTSFIEKLTKNHAFALEILGTIEKTEQ